MEEDVEELDEAEVLSCVERLELAETAEFEEGMDEFAEGLDELPDGFGEFAEGLREFPDGFCVLSVYAAV